MLNSILKIFADIKYPVTKNLEKIDITLTTPLKEAQKISRLNL